MLKTKTYIALLLAAANVPCVATTYELTDPAQSVFGEDQSVQTVYEDTLYDLARHYSLGSEELIRVNPGRGSVDSRADKTVVIPGRHILPTGPRDGIVVNLAEHRLYYYPKPKRHKPQQVITYPGQHRQDGLAHAAGRHACDRQAERSRLESARVGARRARAGWRPPAGVRARRARTIRWAARHAAGRRQRHLPDPWHQQSDRRGPGGHPRLHPHVSGGRRGAVPAGAGGHPVRIVNEPVKVAWVDGELLLEAHPPVDAQGQSFEPDVDKFAELLQKAVGDSVGGDPLGLRPRGAGSGPMACWPRWASRPSSRTRARQPRPAGRPLSRRAGGGRRERGTFSQISVSG